MTSSISLSSGISEDVSWGGVSFIPLVVSEFWKEEGDLCSAAITFLLEARTFRFLLLLTTEP